MYKLHIITACSRPHNLAKLAMSIVPFTSVFDLEWSIIFDAKNVAIPHADIGAFVAQALPIPKDSININAEVYAHENTAGGQTLKNKGMETYAHYGFVYFLDDDTVMHPSMKLFADYVQPGKFFYTMNQVLQDSTGEYYLRRGDNPKPGFIDQGQYIIDREFIGNLRIPNHYCGDGEFAAALHFKNPNAMLYMENVYSYYNALRWETQGEVKA